MPKYRTKIFENLRRRFGRMGAVVELQITWRPNPDREIAQPVLDDNLLTTVVVHLLRRKGIQVRWAFGADDEKINFEEVLCSFTRTNPFDFSDFRHFPRTSQLGELSEWLAEKKMPQQKGPSISEYKEFRKFTSRYLGRQIDKTVEVIAIS